MIDKTQFDQLVADLSAYDLSREELIKKARDVLKLAKQLIYSLHRNEAADGKALQEAKQALDSIAAKDRALPFEGAYGDATQEYAEAMCYLAFRQGQSLPTHIALGISVEDYLSGICDLTGELARRAVREAIKRDKAEVEAIQRFLEELDGQLIRFDFRNGMLRKKYDSVKWNLKKTEEVLYDLR
ncbi:MAG: hypothetical protein V1735_02625 [Nanoarchaeota archaeon]